MNQKVRVDKLFSNLGLLSRSECKLAVKKGRISVNGVLVKSTDDKLNPDLDEVRLDGEVVDTASLVYYMLYKPSGVITANDDKFSETVFNLMKDKRTDLAAVGRLDKDTTGILLITNDGQMNHKLLSPKNHVEKTYQVTIDGVIDSEDYRMLTEGIDIGDEKPTLPAKLKICTETSPQELALTITEGRYHQVKRMFEAVGKPVIKLHRSDFGPLKLDEALKPGEYRKLNEGEMEKLHELMK